MLSIIYDKSSSIYILIESIIGALAFYRAVYIIIGMFFTRKFNKAKKKHKYAILISARNEKYVIGNLLDSINKQDYPKDLITTFVVADNCTDNTADIARSYGAKVYERFDNDHRTKGYALEYLLDQIEKDYGRQSFEGYFIFDADNLLKSNFVDKMNDAFDSGEKIITSYRNTKNFDENWIASTYAVHWIRSVRINHRARSILRLATNIQGTGFLFASEIVKNGWHYTSLTEDRALTVDAVAQGYRISYQDEAMFYDEQPTSLKIALRQRLRWSKGHLQAFTETGPRLFINIFLGKKYSKVKWNNENKKEKNIFKKLFNEIKDRFIMYDTFIQLLPKDVIRLFNWIINMLIIGSIYSYNYGLNNVDIFNNSGKLAKFINLFIHTDITCNPGLKALILCIITTILSRLFYRLCIDIENILMYYYVLIIERKRIKKIPITKFILYSLTWPTFDMIGRYTSYIALFKKVTWKQIPHNSSITINDIENKKESN